METIGKLIARVMREASCEENRRAILEFFNFLEDVALTGLFRALSKTVSRKLCCCLINISASRLERLKHDVSEFKEVRDRGAQCFSRVDLWLKREGQPIMICAFLPIQPMICQMENGRSVLVYPPRRVLRVREIIQTGV